MRRFTLQDVEMMVDVVNLELPDSHKLSLLEVTTENTRGWRLMEGGRPFLHTEEQPLKTLYRDLCMLASGVGLAKRAHGLALFGAHLRSESTDALQDR